MSLLQKRKKGVKEVEINTAYMLIRHE